MRLDQFLSEMADCSRSRAASLIRQGHIYLNKNPVKSSHRLKPGETVSGIIPAEPARRLLPESLPLETLFEDKYLIIINKPPGLVVHPAPGHDQGTLVNGLLARYPDIRGTGTDKGRPGIVHRLDKDTSGAIIIARTQTAFDRLTGMFASREITKIYMALVFGAPDQKTGSIHLPIGRHVTNRKKMSTRSAKARQAETHWRIIKRFKGASLLEVGIKTGRTHQIRVHCAESGTPVVGDRTYNNAGWTKQPARFKNKAIFNLLKGVPRQMLHAWKLEFIHPMTNQKIKCRAPLPQDMKQLLMYINRVS
jgi:23S rRNA pseudouridine1911/1915/1917 synthase